MENIENVDAENTVPEIDEKLISDIVEKRLNEIANKNKPTKTVVNSTFNDTSEVDAKERFRKNINSLYSRQSKGITVDIITKAANETTDSAGGYLTVDEKGDEIISIPNQFGLARQLCTIKPMTSDKRNFPKVTSGLTPYASIEGVALTGSQEVFSQIQLSTKKISVIAPMTNELLDDAAFPLEQELFNSAFTGIGQIEDTGFLVGYGSYFTGITGTSGIGSLTASVTGALSSASLSAEIGDKLADMISTVESANTNYDKNGVFIMHPSVKNQIRKLKNTQGDYIFNQGNPATAYPDTVFGKPVYVSNVMPAISTTTSGTKMIIYGDPKQVFMGIRKEVEIKLSDQGVVGSDSFFEKDMSGYRFIERVDIQVARADAFCTLQLK